MQHVLTGLDAQIRAYIAQAAEAAVQSLPPPQQAELKIEIMKMVSAHFGIDSNPKQG